MDTSFWTSEKTNFMAKVGACDGKWHEIRVEVTQPELIARTKPGYFAR
ncbi:MAG TPA: hypothetical protein VN951_07190 [Pyrinomonadaceae bacterium]|nr:hypothetical protein [Pyrinomonadaceae bacterium]